MTSSRASSASISISEGPAFRSFLEAEEWVRIHWGKDDPQTAKEAAQQMPIRQSGPAQNRTKLARTGSRKHPNSDQYYTTYLICSPSSNRCIWKARIWENEAVNGFSVRLLCDDHSTHCRNNPANRSQSVASTDQHHHHGQSRSVSSLDDEAMPQSRASPRDDQDQYDATDAAHGLSDTTTTGEQDLFNVENLLDLLVPFCTPPGTAIKDDLAMLPVEKELRATLQAMECWYTKSADEFAGVVRGEILLPLPSLLRMMNFFKSRYHSALFVKLPTRVVESLVASTAEKRKLSGEQMRPQLWDYILKGQDSTILGFTAQMAANRPDLTEIARQASHTTRSSHSQPLCFRSRRSSAYSRRDLSMSNEEPAEPAIRPQSPKSERQKWWRSRTKRRAAKLDDRDRSQIYRIDAVPEEGFWESRQMTKTA